MSDQEQTAVGSQPQNGPKTRPTKPLPTDRIAFAKQLQILRAYASASGPSGKAVTNKTVGDIVGMNSSTVSLANSFFVSMGFLLKTDAGYMPSQEVMSFNLAYDWNKDTAAQKLAPLIEKSWFVETLMPRLRFRQLDENEALSTLADAATAGQDYKGQLLLLLSYMEASGLVVLEGGTVRLTKASTSPTLSTSVSDKISVQEHKAVSILPPQDKETQMPLPTLVSSGVAFNINVKVDMTELSTWPADRISAFFSGIAQVLAAKGTTDKKAGDVEK